MRYQFYSIRTIKLKWSTQSIQRIQILQPVTDARQLVTILCYKKIKKCLKFLIFVVAFLFFHSSIFLKLTESKATTASNNIFRRFPPPKMIFKPEKTWFNFIKRDSKTSTWENSTKNSLIERFYREKSLEFLSKFSAHPINKF